MVSIYDPGDETDIDDQRCENCMWWNCDPITDRRRCRNRGSEKNRKETMGTQWCWCWKRDRQGVW